MDPIREACLGRLMSYFSKSRHTQGKVCNPMKEAREPNSVKQSAKPLARLAPALCLGSPSPLIKVT